MMIPIIAITNLVNSAVSAFLTLRLYSNYKRRTNAGFSGIPGIKYFILLYLALTIMWLLYAMPGLLVTNLFIIMILQSIADVFAYIVSIMGVRIAFFAINKRNIGAVFSGIIGASAVFYIIGKMFIPLPSAIEIVYPYIYWHPSTAMWMQILTGVVAAVSSFIFIVTFLILGYRARTNKLIFRRSMFLSVGMSCLFAAAVLFFIYSSGGFIFCAISSLLGIIGLLLMKEGIAFEDNISDL